MTIQPEKQPTKSHRLLTALLLFLLCMTAMAATVVILWQHPLLLKTTSITHELGTPFAPRDNIRFVFFGRPDQVSVKDNVDPDTLGDYSVTYTFNGKTATARVSVQDTTPPQLVTQPHSADLHETLTPEAFVKTADDISPVTLRFAKEEAWDAAGTYELEIVATDASGNATTKTATLKRVDDHTAPTITGASDQSILQGEPFALPAELTAKDDLDPEPTLELDDSSLDVTTPGTYTVRYIARDRSGNETSVQGQVTVVANPEWCEKVVYLTFDDGPSANTEAILSVLRKYNAKATFFVTGHAPTYRHLITQAYKEGHAIGLHTYSHDYGAVYASKDAYFSDLAQIASLVEQATGTPSHLLRFPGGSSNTVSANYCPGIMSALVGEVKTRGYQYFDWNCDSRDASGTNIDPDTIVKNATASNERFVNILMHDSDSKATTAQALPRIIEHYRAEGYTFRALTPTSYAPHHGVNN